jgi:hypothetical protein
MVEFKRVIGLGLEGIDREIVCALDAKAVINGFEKEARRFDFYFLDDIGWFGGKSDLRIPSLVSIRRQFK